MQRVGDIADYAVLVYSRDETVAQQGLGEVIVQALLLMSEDAHPEDDRAAVAPGRLSELSPEEAYLLVKENGSLRLAAANSEYSRSALHRALQRYQEVRN